MLRARYALRRFEGDPVTTTLGYWTDNGAYYYGDSHAQTFARGDATPDLSCCSLAEFARVKAALDADNAAVAAARAAAAELDVDEGADGGGEGEPAALKGEL